MKAEKVAELKPKFKFEAPFLPAAIIGSKGKIKLKKDSTLDLNVLLAPKPKNIYMVRVTGESMKDEGIYEGDILVVDKGELPKDGKVVIAALNGEMAVKTYREINNKIYLFSANQRFLPIEILPYWEFKIQGVVKHVIHNV